MNKLISHRYTTTDYFGSYQDYLAYYQKGNVEVMVHPVLCEDGFVYDKVGKDRFENMVNYKYDK